MPISQITTNSIASNTITSGILATGQTLSVNGITFPATQSASSDANTLDDYEEGTWTPTLNANLTGAAGYTAGQYVKIGQMCYLNYSLKVGTVSGGNAVTITLPFTSASSFTNGNSDQGAMIYTGGPDTGDIGTLAYISGNNTMIELYQVSDNAGGVPLTNSQLAVNDFLFVNLCYRTA